MNLYTLSVWVIPLVIAITFHEAAHGFVAYRFGDDTAWNLGRVSFNPIRHIDPFGTLLLPAMLLFTHSPFLFGYAKPVPVNFRALSDPRLGMIMVALAGPPPTSCSRWPVRPAFTCSRWFRPTMRNGWQTISKIPSLSMSCWPSLT
jgi:Zn-dependent protease